MNITQNIKDYGKAVYANKFTLVGYVSALVGVGSLFYLGDKLAMDFNELNLTDKIASAFTLISSVGFSGLSITLFGLETYNAYVRTKKDIERYGSIKKSYINSNSGFYCNRVGVELAIKEAGLEKILKD